MKQKPPKKGRPAPALYRVILTDPRVGTKTHVRKSFIVLATGSEEAVHVLQVERPDAFGYNPKVEAEAVFGNTIPHSTYTIDHKEYTQRFGEAFDL